MTTPRSGPSVQVGDPFAEKLLIEASLELIERGLVEGLQDLGAGGITCATSETADRAGTGIRIDLDAIPRREPGLEPFEVLISESQERMCAAVRPDRWPDVREVCERWGLPVAVIGRVTDDGDIAVIEGGLDADGRPAPGASELARIPASALTSDAIVHERIALAADPPPRCAGAGRAGRGQRQPARTWDGSRRGPAGPARVAEPRRRAGSCTSSTTRPSGRTRSPGRVMAPRSSGSRARPRALVAATDANHAVGQLDPWLGAALSVAEATRNVSITGARPLGVTNCLNYGDPTRPEAFWQLSEGVRGVGDACRALGLPVTGGNVSLYNESPEGAIAPTPEIGVVGLDRGHRHASWVRPSGSAGDAIVLVGDAMPGLAGSAYALLAGDALEDGPPGLDLEREAAVQAFIREAIAPRPGRFRAGRLGWRACRCARGMRDVGRDGSARAHRAGRLAGGGAVRREPVAAGRVLRSAARARRSSCWRGSTGCRSSGSGRLAATSLVIESTGAGPMGASEERGSRVADALEVPLTALRHAWDHGLARALGWEG